MAINGIGLARPAGASPLRTPVQAQTAAAPSPAISPPTIEAAPQVSAPSASLAASPAATPKSKFGQIFKENPLQAIGVILSSLGGDTSVAQAFIKQRDQAERAGIRRMQVTVSALEQGVEMVSELPEGDRERFMDQYAAQFEGAIPGFRALLESASQQPDITPLLKAAGEHAPILAPLANGNFDKLRELLTDNVFMGRLDEMADNRNREVVAAKLGMFAAKIEGALSPEQLEQLPRDQAGRLQLTMAELEALNRQIPEGERFTPSEFGTLRRNPDILESFGIASPKSVSAFAEQRAQRAGTLEAERGRFTVTRDEQGNYVQTDTITGETKITKADGADPTQLAKLQNERHGKTQELLQAEANGDTTTAARLSEELSELNARIDKETSIVGRTAEDLEATEDKSGARTTGKLQAEEKQEAMEYLLNDVQASQDVLTALDTARSAEGDVTGLRGLLGRTVGGLMQQAAPELAIAFNNLIGAKQPEEIQAAKVQFEKLVASNIPQIAGDDSGRYTDIERSLTSLVIAAADPNASQEQVVAALEELYKFRVMIREGKNVAAGRPFDYQLLKDDGSFDGDAVVAAYNDLRDKGLSDEGAKDLVNRLVKLYGGLSKEREARSGR